MKTLNRIAAGIGYAALAGVIYATVGKVGWAALSNRIERRRSRAIS